MIEPLDVGKVVKAIRFYYRPTLQTIELPTTFRDMVNHAIDICLREKINGRLNLRNRIYREFREHPTTLIPRVEALKLGSWDNVLAI